MLEVFYGHVMSLSTIQFAQTKAQAFADAVFVLKVPGNFLTSSVTISFSRKSL
jgi:hypothetical protein